MTAIFLQGHVLDVLRGLPSAFVHCCVTSPPYWGLREYAGEQGVTWPDSWTGSYGRETTIQMYVSHTVEILRAIRRVLRADGVCFWVVGDSYASVGKWGGSTGGKHTVDLHGQTGIGRGKREYGVGLKTKDLCLIPQRVALAVQADGWYLRSDIIWHKTNGLPESVAGWRWERHRVKVGNNGRGREPSRGAQPGRPQQDHDGREYRSDAVWAECLGCPTCSPTGGLVLRKGSWRPTDCHEYVLMLAKSEKYYADGEAVKEKSAGQDGQAANFQRTTKDDIYPGQSVAQHRVDRKPTQDNGTRSLRNVWTFSTQPYKGAHFACFPPRLPELAIRSSTSEKGRCPSCGAPWVRVVEKGLTVHDGRTKCSYPEGSTANRLALLRQAARERGGEYVNQQRTTGWLPSCECGGGPVPCLVLDPFSGAGTTALAAERLGRDSINIDLSAEYIQMAKERLAADEAKRIEQLVQSAKREAQLAARAGR